MCSNMRRMRAGLKLKSPCFSPQVLLTLQSIFRLSFCKGIALLAVTKARTRLGLDWDWTGLGLGLDWDWTGQ